MDEAGGFVVVWAGFVDQREKAFGRRFDSEGNALGGDFAIGTTGGDHDKEIPRRSQGGLWATLS